MRCVHRFAASVATTLATTMPLFMYINSTAYINISFYAARLFRPSVSTRRIYRLTFRFIDELIVTRRRVFEIANAFFILCASCRRLAVCCRSLVPLYGTQHRRIAFNLMSERKKKCCVDEECVEEISFAYE